MRNARPTHSISQRGSTLLVAVVILLLASLMGLMAMNVGVFEQRSSGNDLRAKVVHQAAEAGLAEGFEYLFRADHGTPANPAYTLVDDAALWEPCPAADVNFPCGAVDASVRATMFRLKPNVGGYGTSAILPAELTRHMLPNTTALPAMGGLSVAYGVAPVLCRIPLPLSSTSITCSTDTLNISDRRVVTFVSVAQIAGDAGRTTLTQTVARSSLLAQQAGVPTIVASGTVIPPGNGDVVAMPDAAGPGLDISVWSRLDVKPDSGAFATCGRHEFLASKQVSLTDPGWIASRNCANCECPVRNKDKPQPEDWDILDRDNDVAGINKDVKPEEFPCDLFEYVFNVSAWKDRDGDHFCEARADKVSFRAPDGKDYPLHPDEAFLYQNAAKIKPAPGNTHLVRAEQLFTGTLGGADSGLAWCQVDCLPNGGVMVGSVAKPIAVVADAGTNDRYHAKLFGLLFFRSTGDGPLDPKTGGNVAMKFNGRSEVYGSMVVQGQITQGSGRGLIFGDADILKALGGLQTMARFDTLRGGWTDRNSY